MITKTYTALLLVLVIALITVPATLAAVPAKIANIDIEKALDGYDKWQVSLKELKALEKDLKDQQTTAEQEIQTKLKSLALLVKPEDKAAQRQQIENYRTAQIEMLRPKAEELKEKQKQYLQEALADLKKAIDVVAKAQNLDAVFTSEVCVYAKTDITQSVSEKANQMYKKEKTDKK